MKKFIKNLSIFNKIFSKKFILLYAFKPYVTKIFVFVIYIYIYYIFFFLKRKPRALGGL